jgi:hypothetical protein
MEIRDIEARIQIQEVLYRYCHGIDRLDRELLRSCFHPGSMHVKFGDSSEAFCDYAITTLAPPAFVLTHHQLGNILPISIQGDAADVETYFTAYHRIGSKPPPHLSPDVAGFDWIVRGRYMDRFERREGVWRIVRRNVAHDWMRYDPPADRGFMDLPRDKFQYT